MSANVTSHGVGRGAVTSRGVVLVLDDDPVVGELLSLVLGRAGFEPVALGDWHAARDVIDARPNDVVAAVCDLQLGNSNGAEVLGALRRLAPDLRTIVMSGHPEEHVHAELERAGTDAIVFQKPFSPADLVAVITDEA